MNVLISGGAKNGKSWYAQRIAREMAEEAGRPLYYIATMIPTDEEDLARIRRHRREREGWGFTTIEAGKNLPGLLDGVRGRQEKGAPASGCADPAVDSEGVFLLDSVTALLGNEMFDPAGNFDPLAAERVARDCTAFAKATGSTVFVSDYIYGDAEDYGELTEEYRKGLALADRALAKVCERVVEVSAGCIEDWKVPGSESGGERRR